MDYPALIERHWRTFRPQATAGLSDPHQFFLDLGARAEQMVEELTTQLLDREPPETDFLARQQQLLRAQRQAEEIVLANEVFLPPETDSLEAELPTGPLPPLPPSPMQQPSSDWTASTPPSSPPPSAPSPTAATTTPPA